MNPIYRFAIAIAVSFGVLSVPHVVLSYSQGYYQSSYYGQGGYYSQSYYQSYYQAGYYSQSSYSTTFTRTVASQGNFAITGTLSKGSGTFAIDHPLDPKNKLLFHSFVESPDVKNIYDGVATLDGNGEAIVELPAYFEALNRDFRYQLEAISGPMPNLYVSGLVEGNRFAVAGGKQYGEVSWQVTGIRHDPYIEKNPIVVEVEKGPNTLVEKGEYLIPDVYREPLIRRIVAFLGNLF